MKKITGEILIMLAMCCGVLLVSGIIGPIAEVVETWVVTQKQQTESELLRAEVLRIVRERQKAGLQQIAFVH